VFSTLAMMFSTTRLVSFEMVDLDGDCDAPAAEEFVTFLLLQLQTPVDVVDAQARSPTSYTACYYLCKRWPHLGDRETTGAVKFSLCASFPPYNALTVSLDRLSLLLLLELGLSARQACVRRRF